MEADRDDENRVPNTATGPEVPLEGAQRSGLDRRLEKGCAGMDCEE